MSASSAFLILGVGQAVIYVVMRRFLKQAAGGEPTPLLRGIVVLIGVVALALLAAAGYLAIVGES